MNITSTQAAKYAALVMYAWDMCDADLHNVRPIMDGRIKADGWEIVGYISGSDDVVKAGSGIRSMVLRASSDEVDRVCYGYVAHNQAGDYVAVIRGTDGAEEWRDDFDFMLRNPSPPLEGQVEMGFYGIFDTMQYHPMEGSPSLRLSDGIVRVVGDSPTVVLGHSLGSALATYLTAELVDRTNPPKVSACLFASPKPGDQEFANYFVKKVTNYSIFNYEEDVVPDTPPLGYAAIPGCTVLTQAGSSAKISPEKACCHHLISYIALLEVNEFKRVIALQGTTPDDRKCAACVTFQSQ